MAISVCGGMLRGVVKSVFEPGVNSHLWIALNVAFLCLVVVTCVLFIVVGFNVHLAVLFALSVGLLLSVNW